MMVKPLSFFVEFRELGIGDKDETGSPDECEMSEMRQERTRQ